MTSTRRTTLLALALALTLLSSACGSTLQPSGTQTVASGDGLSGTSADASGSEGGLGDGLGGDLSGTTSDTVAGGGPAGSSTGGGGPSAGPGATTPGGVARPGATTPAGGAAAAKTGPVRVGVVGVDVTALHVVFGGAGNSSTVFDGFKRFLAYMNKTGGLAGRPIEAVYETVDIAEDYNAAGQRTCERFTTDNKVDFAVLNMFSNEVLISCLRQRGVTAFDQQVWANDRGSLDHPNWFTPVALPVDRYAPALISVGVEQGFMKRGDKIGVLREDCPWAARTYNGPVKAAASKAGVTTVEATTKCVENLVGDIGPATNQIQQAALRFFSSGATHVLMLTAAEGFFITQFQQAAAQQEYHPKYFFTSNGFPYNNTHPDSSLQWQAADLPNMLGLGNLPYIDVGLRAQPADATQAAAQAKCKEADPQTGTQAATEDPARAQATANFYFLCDLFFVIREQARLTGGRFDIASLTSAYRASLGKQPSAGLTGGRFLLAGKRLEGAGVVQPMKFNAQRQPVYFDAVRPLT